MSFTTFVGSTPGEFEVEALGAEGEAFVIDAELVHYPSACRSRTWTGFSATL